MGLTGSGPRRLATDSSSAPTDGRGNEVYHKPGMASWQVTIGLVMMAFSFVSTAVSLVAPYWMVYNNKASTYGLLAWCVGDKCSWFFESFNDWNNLAGEQKFHFIDKNT